MPALAAAGYHVIAPNQRGYGNSSRPVDVADYDIADLTGDLVALLDHFGYDHAAFVGHDWGAKQPWIEMMEQVFGSDFYFVHFNRQPGVADAVLDENTDDPIIHTPALMIRGENDVIPKFERLSEFVPDVEEVSLDCGHWIQQELPDETAQVILNWLERRDQDSQPVRIEPATIGA